MAVRSGIGRGLAAWIVAALSNILPSAVMGRSSASGMEESRASESGLAAFEPASREYRTFSARDCTSFLDFLVPKLCVSSVLEA